MAVAANALCTVQEVKDYVQLTDNSYDTLLEALINRASDAIEAYCDNYFINRTDLVETYDGDGTRELWLRHYPIVSVTHVKEDGTTIDSTYYLIYAGEGRIMMHPDYGYLFTKGYQNFEVKFDAGRGATHTDVPQDIKLACIQLVGYWQESDVAFYSRAVSEGVVTETPTTAIPRQVRSLLDPYVKRHVR